MVKRRVFSRHTANLLLLPPPRVFSRTLWDDSACEPSPLSASPPPATSYEGGWTKLKQERVVQWVLQEAHGFSLSTFCVSLLSSLFLPAAIAVRSSNGPSWCWCCCWWWWRNVFYEDNIVAQSHSNNLGRSSKVRKTLQK